jgi:deazaflavin-dependent oxidoreductase (nitroreductase family)
MPQTPLIWRLMRFMNRHVAVSKSPRVKGGELVLVLYTTGRKSGLERATPLQYEKIDGAYYVASARGAQADWYRNLLANPQVAVQVRGQRLPARAEAVTDPQRIAGFLEQRLRRHPRMMRAMLRLEGLGRDFTPADLLRIAASKTLVILHPIP